MLLSQTDLGFMSIASLNLISFGISKLILEDLLYLYPLPYGDIRSESLREGDLFSFKVADLFRIFYKNETIENCLPLIKLNARN